MEFSIPWILVLLHIILYLIPPTFFGVLYSILSGRTSLKMRYDFDILKHSGVHKSAYDMSDISEPSFHIAIRFVLCRQTDRQCVVAMDCVGLGN
jgi:hypothetical protein